MNRKKLDFSSPSVWCFGVAPLWPHQEVARARRRSAEATSAAVATPSPAAAPSHAAASGPSAKEIAAGCLASAEEAVETGDWPEAIRWARRGLRLADADYLLRAIEAQGARGRSGALLLVRALAVKLQGRAEGAPVAQLPRERTRVATGHRTILLVGGIGRMRSQYRDVVEARGYALDHIENRQDRLARLRGAPAAVLVVVTEVSHPLREHAQRIAASAQAPLVFLKAPSLSALRKGLDRVAESETARAEQ